MSFIDILLLLIFALEFLLGVFVLLNGYKKTVNRILAFFSFCVAGWGGSVLLVKYTESILAARFAFAFGTLLILTYVLFAAVFPNRKKINFSLYIFAIPALFFLVSSFYGDFLFSDFIIRGGAIIAERGILYPWFVLFSIVYIAVSAYFLTIKYRSSFGKSRLQMNYFLAGLFTFMIGGTFSNIILPALGVQFFNTIGPAFSIFFVVATTYSIVRFRLMDIRLVFKKSFVYASALATLVIIVGGASVFEDLFFSTFIPLWMKNFLIVTFSVLIFEPLNRFYSYIANKYFFTGNKTYRRATRCSYSDFLQYWQY